MRDQALAKLRAVLTQDFRVPADAVVETADFRADLWLDSVAIIDLFYVLQRDFGFSAEAEDFAALRTVGDLVDFVVMHMRDAHDAGGER